ncbi:MAG: hypothetical protein Q4G39_07160 [Brachymonas sp.]|nr:hypothetical protein [Brachymonas sp.]
MTLLSACANTKQNTIYSVSDMPPAVRIDGLMVGSASRLALYTYSGDGPNTSACVDTCVQQWPPLLATEGDVSRGDFTVFTRPDGLRQWALVGKPLYFWSGERQPGETGGEAVDPQWRAFRVQ